MGFFDSLPSMMDLEAILKEQKKREAKYLRMDTAELKMLNDDELYEAVRARVCGKVFASEHSHLNTEETVFYAVDTLDGEINNGGLCQFFVNFDQKMVSVIGQCLSIIGAEEHKAIYEKFLRDYKINVEDLSNFEIRDVSDYIKCAEKYPFEEFDNTYFTLPSVQEYLIPYVRNNIQKF